MDNIGFVGDDVGGDAVADKTGTPASLATTSAASPQAASAAASAACPPAVSAAASAALPPAAPAAASAACPPAAPAARDDDRGATTSTQLQRTLGAPAATAIILGTMIGAGIFVSSQSVLARTGSVGLSLLVWAGCGVLSTLGALCYVELGVTVPKSGGEFAYLLDSLGPLHDFAGPLPAFLFAWTTCLVTRPATTAIQGLAFAEYCLQPVCAGRCPPPPLAVSLVAVCAVGLASFVNCYSVRLTTAMQSAFTVAKLAAIGVILCAGGYWLARGQVRHLATGFAGSTSDASDVATAFYGGLWAFDGWNNLNFVTEELVAPGRDLPRVVGAALPLVTVLYLLVNAAYLTVLSPDQLVASPAVAVTFAERGLGALAPLVPLGVALSVYGALNGNVLTTSRLCFAAARRGHFARVLGLVHARRLTPAPAVLFNAVAAVAMIAAGDIDDLIDCSSFTVWLFYGLAMVALLVLRRSRPRAPHLFRAPAWMPYAVLCAACCLVLGPVIAAPRLMHLCVAAFLLLGVGVYARCVYRRRTPLVVRHVTMVAQKLLELVPSAG